MHQPGIRWVPQPIVHALITEHGSNRGALAAARSLRGAGWTVDVATSSRSLTARSRSVRQVFQVRSPSDDPAAFVADIARVIEQAGSEVVFPVDETHLLALSEHRDALGAVLPYGSHDVIVRATDRLDVAATAVRCGLATPPTWSGTVEQLEGWSGPVVVKGRVPALIGAEGGISRVATRIGDAGEARRWLGELHAAGAEAVVQQSVRGRLASAAVLTDGDATVVAECHQTTDRTWPPDAGVSTRACTVAVDRDLSARIAAFLRDLRWVGLVQLQFIVGSDGTEHLIDVNPRFYGSLELAIRAGVDFPTLWAASATGRPLTASRTPRAGVRYQWLGGDLRHAARSPRGSLARDVGASLAWSRSAVHPIWSPRDPLPTVYWVAAFARGRLARSAR